MMRAGSRSWTRPRQQILGAAISYVSEGAFLDPTLAVIGDYAGRWRSSAFART